jgi:prepilin-type N-terminal cleavage/methylation domain-containing protein
MDSSLFSLPHARRDRGFTLVEIAVVLIIMSLMLAMAALLFRGISAGQKRSLTVARLAGVDAALAQFVALQKRLPCPADGRKTLTSDPATVGGEERDGAGACTSVQHGVVPWKTLGIAEPDATDGWDHRLTYRVQGSLAADNGMDMSMCDPASQPPNNPATAVATCNAGCTSALLATGFCTLPRSFLIGKGLEVRSGGTKVMDPAAALPGAPTGAAYVLISHGESGGGAYSTTGQLQATLSTDGTEELRNYANQTMPAGWYFADESPSDVAGTSHFDDMISRPSVLAVINKAGLGPRSH